MLENYKNIRDKAENIRKNMLACSFNNKTNELQNSVNIVNKETKNFPRKKDYKIVEETHFRSKGYLKKNLSNKSSEGIIKR